MWTFCLWLNRNRPVQPKMAIVCALSNLGLGTLAIFKPLKSVPGGFPALLRVLGEPPALPFLFGVKRPQAK